MRLGKTLFAAMALVWTAQAFAAIDEWAKSRFFVEAEISPNGEYVAVMDINADRTYLDILRLSDLKMQYIGAASGAQIVSYDWVSPDRVMYSIGEHWGGEDQPVPNGELYAAAADLSSNALVFGYRAGVTMPSASHIKQAQPENAVGLLIAPIKNDPNFALIASYPLNRESFHGGSTIVHSEAYGGSFPDVYKMDLRNGNKVRLLTSPLRRASFLADHDSVVRFTIGYGDDYKLKVYYRADAHSDWQHVWDEAKDANDFRPIMFDRSGQNVYVHCGTKAGDAICRWNTQTHQSTTIWSGKDTSDAELVRTFDGLDAFAIRTLLGRPVMVLIDKSAPEVNVLRTLMGSFSGEDIQFTSASADGKKVVFLASADVDPGVYYLYDVDNHKAVRLFERRPGVKVENMASMQPIELKARDGLDLHGYLTKPPGHDSDRNLPTVVLVHGGPYLVRDVWGFHSQVQMLAAQGYAVLQVNFRGSSGFGDDFERAGYREWGGKMQDDVTDATRWAIAQGISDPKRICIFGASYGGYAALEGAVKEPDLYRCAIGYVGVYDLRLMKTHGDTLQSAYGVNYLKQVLGDDDADLWNRSPIAHLDALKAKVMLIVGGADVRVPPIQGESLHNALLQRHIEHEWIYERTEGHGFYTDEHLSLVYTSIRDFLARQIGPSGKTSSP